MSALHKLGELSSSTHGNTTRRNTRSSSGLKKSSSYVEQSSANGHGDVMGIRIKEEPPDVIDVIEEARYDVFHSEAVVKEEWDEETAQNRINAVQENLSIFPSTFCSASSSKNASSIASKAKNIQNYKSPGAGHQGIPYYMAGAPLGDIGRQPKEKEVNEVQIKSCKTSTMKTGHCVEPSQFSVLHLPKGTYGNSAFLQNASEDEDEQFMLSILPELKKLPEYIKAEIKAQILQIIINARQGCSEIEIQ